MIKYHLKALKLRMENRLLSRSAPLAKWNFEPVLSNIIWDRLKPMDCSEQMWRRIQVGRYLESSLRAKPKEVLKWVLSHSPNPWPHVDSNAITKLVNRIKISRSTQMHNAGIRKNIKESMTEMIMDSKLDQVRRLLNELPQRGREEIASELAATVVQQTMSCTLQFQGIIFRFHTIFGSNSTPNTKIMSNMDRS